MSAKFLKIVAPVLMSAVLLGCSTDAAKCPMASALVDTATLTVFASPQDTSHPLYTVQINKVNSDCDISKSEHSASNDLDITFTATRSSAGPAEAHEVPYFVAVTLGDKVMNKKSYMAHLSFEDGATTATFDESVDSTDVRFQKGKHAYDYALLVGFQLTQQQLEYNRTSGRFPK